MDFDRVISGIIKYLDREIYIGMNDWQEMLARIAVSRVIGNKDHLKEMIVSNPFVRTFNIIDEDGIVDVDGLMRDLKEQIAQKGKIEISIPMFGKFVFNSSDVDKLHKTIMEGA
jgi:hypothetical protein